MAAKLRHRGPDGEGQWTDTSASIAHRLRRVVPGRSEQPVVSGDTILVMDGWLFEHERLALSVGHDPTGHTDASTLLAAWRRWGAELGRHVQGEYAAVVWHRRAGVLTLLRDRLGTRPLYVCRVGDRVAFASDLPALLEAPFVPRALDREAVAEYLSFQAVHAPRTLLLGVSQVEPACWVQLSAAGTVSQRFWTPRYATERSADASERLQAAVDAAVKRRVDSVDAGRFLSGGLGSAAIASSCKRRFIELPTFTVSFDDDPYPESPFAGRVARLFDLEHHEVTVGSKALADAFDPTVEAMGHPIAQPAAILQLLLGRAARERVRVVLSGDGSEELLGGRAMDVVARRLRAAELWARLPGRGSLEALLARIGRGRSLRGPTADWPLALGLGGYDLFDTEARSQLLADPSMVQPDIRQRVLEPWYRDLSADPIHTILHGHFRSTLQGVAIPRADRMGAAAGLDVRFPLLDSEVVDAAMAIPSSQKRSTSGLHTRWPLRAMVSGVLPPALLNRPKRGPPTPLGGWLAGPGRLFLESRLQRLKENRFGLWRVEALEALKREVTHANAAGNRLWALFFLDAWMQKHLG